jgi:hypothetical protein
MIAGTPPAVASSVSPELGSVAKMVADTSVSKPHLKKGGSKGPPFHIGRDRSTSRVQDASKQASAYRTNENAAYREPLDDADTSAASDADGRRAKEGAATEGTANKDGSSPRRESENNAQELPAEAAGCPEGLKLDKAPPH